MLEKVDCKKGLIVKRKVNYTVYLIYSSIFLIFSFIISINSYSLTNGWGQPGDFSKYSATIFTVTLFLLAVVMVTREVISRAKYEQYSEDVIKFFRLNRIDSKDLHNQVVYNKKELQEILQDKIKLAEIHECPQLSLILYEKSVNIKDELGVRLKFFIEGNLSTLNRISIPDLIKFFNNIFLLLHKCFKEMDVEQRVSPLLFLSDKDSSIHVNLVFIYSGPLDSCKSDVYAMEWNMKRLMLRYKITHKSSFDKDSDGLVTASLLFEIPKVARKSFSPKTFSS